MVGAVISAIKEKIYIGQVFTRLTVIDSAPKYYNGNTQWKCKCSCGTIKLVQQPHLLSGATKSCGCLHRQITAKRNIETSTTHGLSFANIYKIWNGMKQRCYNKNNKDYKHYGRRGIKVCERWQKFENFFLDMGHPPINASLDRIDNNGDYTPENCRWSTHDVQMSNRRANITHITTKTIVIKCPMCHKLQTMEQDKITKIWFCIAPFCCSIMKDGDSKEWNQALDRAILESMH